MPSKRQKQSEGVDGSTVATPEPEPHNYICINRPFFDADSEHRLQWKNDEDESCERQEISEKLYDENFKKEKEAGICSAPAAEHPDHKWVIMKSAVLKYNLWRNKAQYCNPDYFNMHLYTDWHGWGLQEIIENQLKDFDKAFHEKSEQKLEDMWAVVSAMGLWFNTADGIDELYGNENGDKTCGLVGLVGCALITALDAIEAAGELKRDSKFLDLPLVIGEYLEFTEELPDMGIEGECMMWRKEVVEYFKRGNLDALKGTFTTDMRIKQLEKADSNDVHPASRRTSGANSPPTSTGKRKRAHTKSDSKDKWQWASKFKDYKKQEGPAIGGQHYDITKMSKKERMEASFDGTDPLAGVPAKDLKENLLRLA